METKLSNELTLLTARLMLANSKREIIELSNDFGSLIQKVIEQEKKGYTPERITDKKTVTATIKFTKMEIAKMHITLKKDFIANGLVARIIKRESGKNSYIYEIRYRRNGFNISVSHKDLATAKEKFLLATSQKELEKYLNKKQRSKNSLENIFTKWIELKNGTICEKEILRYKSNFNNLPIAFKKENIEILKITEIEKFLKSVKPRKYEELRTLFNGIYKYALADGIITHNPMTLIKFKRAERQNRNALNEEEIKNFFIEIKKEKYNEIRQFAYVLYFFGVRPCEIDEETRKDGDFLIIRNRKRKNGKIEYKKIPIPSQANEFIEWNKELTTNLSKWKKETIFKDLMGENTAYCLRHTFATTCQQYVRPDIVDIWMGDSPQRLVGKVYTHFPDKFMKEQMDKVIFLT